MRTALKTAQKSRPWRGALSQQGFTLTEVLVAVAIFAIIFVAALLIYDRSNQVFRSGMQASDVQQNTRVAFDTLVADLRMAGFDYDRDGDPLTSAAGVTQRQQPDEQFEYIGRSALTLRGNFDYETDAANDNGREPALESAQFPVVTTGNDEIVTYVLRSDDASKNVDKIEFFADVPTRTVYPGGSTESAVTIPDVDLSNDNPPYTLYRVHLDAAGAPVFQPLADNIRSLTFTYFEDTTGQVPLTNISGTAAVDQENIDSIVGGLGKYDPDNPGATLQGRILRSKVRSLRIDLIGMNEQPDINYTDPYETLAAAKNYRKYNLASTIAPRNIGKRGVKEQSIQPPGPPTVNDVCFGLSGMALLNWTPYPTTGSKGAAEQFEMLADPVGTAVWPIHAPAFGSTSGWLTDMDPGTASPGTTYSYAVRAINGYGSEISVSPFKTGVPWNNTTLEAPANLTATGPDDPVAGGIQLNWDAPVGYVTGKDKLNCASGAVKPAPFQLGEIAGYRVWRSKEEEFVPSSANRVYNESSSAVVKENATGTVSVFDVGVAPCKSFYYRVMAVKTRQTAFTGPNGAATSAVYPVAGAGSPGIEGYAESTGIKPNAPINLSVVEADSDQSTDPYIVKLKWPRVVADVDGNRTGVDDYVVNRYRRVLDLNPYEVDPTWDNSSPQVEDALAQGAEVVFTDSTAPMKDTVTGLQWKYEYSVQAKTCNDLSAESVRAAFPPPCSFGGSTIIESGAASGDGSEVNPWVMDSGDVIYVTPPGGVTLSKVVFSVYDSGGELIETAVDEDASGGFYYVWKDLADNEMYRVLMTITNDQGCVEQKDRWVLDQAVAPCTVAPASVVQGPEISGNGQTRYKDFTVTLDNTGDENLNLQSVAFTWADAQAANATLYSITYEGGAVDTSFSPAAPGPGTITESVPNGTLSVTPSDASYDIVVRFKYDAKVGNVTKDLTNAISSFCVAYSISSEPGVVKYCNVVGATSGNPDACDTNP